MEGASRSRVAPVVTRVVVQALCAASRWAQATRRSTSTQRSEVDLRFASMCRSVDRRYGSSTAAIYDLSGAVAQAEGAWMLNSRGMKRRRSPRRGKFVTRVTFLPVRSSFVGESFPNRYETRSGRRARPASEAEGRPSQRTINATLHDPSIVSRPLPLPEPATGGASPTGHRTLKAACPMGRIRPGTSDTAHPTWRRRYRAADMARWPMPRRAGVSHTSSRSPANTGGGHVAPRGGPPRSIESR